ncbi:hypothetical protein LY12_004951 [Prauserella alba]|nr:hypothetical protein [Prauserella alba]
MRPGRSPASGRCSGSRPHTFAGSAEFCTGHRMFGTRHRVFCVPVREDRYRFDVRSRSAVRRRPATAAVITAAGSPLFGHHSAPAAGPGSTPLAAPYFRRVLRRLGNLRRFGCVNPVSDGSVPGHRPGPRGSDRQVSDTGCGVRAATAVVFRPRSACADRARAGGPEASLALGVEASGPPLMSPWSPRQSRRRNHAAAITPLHSRRCGAAHRVDRLHECRTRVPSAEHAHGTAARQRVGVVAGRRMGAGHAEVFVSCRQGRRSASSPRGRVRGPTASPPPRA